MLCTMAVRIILGSINVSLAQSESSKNGNFLFLLKSNVSPKPLSSSKCTKGNFGNMS